MLNIFEGENFTKMRNEIELIREIVKAGNLPREDLRFLEGIIWDFDFMVKAIEKDYEREKLYKD